MENEIICYGQTRGFDWAQENYETASRTAGRRARQLRKVGYHVTVCPMGSQITSVGAVNMTMIDIRETLDITIANLPDVRIERI